MFYTHSWHIRIARYTKNDATHKTPFNFPIFDCDLNAPRLYAKSAIDNDNMIIAGKSRVNTPIEVISNGLIAPLNPTTASALKKLEPTILPTTKSC